MSDQDTNASPEQAASEEDNGAQFIIQRIYLKDASLEAPNQVETFQAQWEPEVDLNIGTATNKLGDDHYEVELTVTATIKSQDKTAYLVEVKQAGIFGIRGYSPEQTQSALGTYCPTTLFPYAREAISDLVSKAGFPQFILAPVNFDQMYQQHLERRAAKQEEQNA